MKTPKTILALLLLSILACARTTPQLKTGQSAHTLTHNGRERSYILYTPESAKNDRLPVVLVFHGGTGNAESAIRMSGFNDVADQNGFLVVYPNGTGRLSDEKLLTWNGGDCCGYAQTENIDDVGFVRAIIADLENFTTIDKNRIYATGMSNGGILSHRLGCQASDLIAAIAPVAGTLNLPSCAPSEPVSVIEFHGTNDQHIPYEGGVGIESLVDVDFTSVQDSIDLWRTVNGCPSESQKKSFDDIQHEVWTDCQNGSAIERYTIVDGGHSWPGGEAGRERADQPTQSINASELIWDFFATHPKP